MEKNLEKLLSVSRSYYVGVSYEDPSAYVWGLKKASDHQIYEYLMDIQVIASLEDDLKLLFNDPVWIKAKNILDIGCGPGHLIKHLKNFFPDKTFTGIDIKDSSIDLAKSVLDGAANCKLICKNIFDFSGDLYDYITARAIVQHLPNAEDFLKCARKLLKSGGHLLILDAADHLDFESPKIPLIDKFNLKNAELQKKKGGNRAVQKEIEKYCTSAGFEIEKCLAVPLSAATPLIKEIFIKRSLLMSEFCHRLFGVAIDQLKFAEQLIDWAKKDSSYAQHGYLQMVLK